MEAIKPALEALEGLISDIEKSLIAKNDAAKTDIDSGPTEASREAPNSSSAEASEAAPRASLGNGTASKEKKKKKDKKPKQPPPPTVAPEIAQFLQCDLRVGRITDVSHHPEADGLYVMQVTYANDETRTVCAGLRKFLTEEELSNRLVVTICNLKPRKLRGVASEAMILAGSVVSGGEKKTVVPISPPDGVQPGDIVGAQGVEGERTVSDGKFVSGKTWDKVVPRLNVKNETACYDGKPLVVSAGVVTCKLPDGTEIH